MGFSSMGFSGTRDRPLPSASFVREARDAYLAENGFTVEEYDARWTAAAIFGIRIWVLNTKSHRRGIMLHDLHHVATGYGTDLAGEAEISAWEIGGGLRGLGLYVGSIVVMGALMGMVLAPRRTLAAYRLGRKNLFRVSLDDYERLLAMPVGELRRELRVPNEGLAKGPQKRHAYAPAH